jgi:ribonuclease T1
MRGWLLTGLALWIAAAVCCAPAAAAQEKMPVKLPKGVPEKVGKVLQYVDEHGKAMPGYEGGRNFGNFEKLLPAADKNDKKIRYQEWDVNPHRPGVNRGAERLVTGSDGSAYYSKDHYKSFIKIR